MIKEEEYDWGVVLQTAQKFKAVMLKRGITAAKTPCPICKTGMIHGGLFGRKQHLHAKCDTPDCFQVME